MSVFALVGITFVDLPVMTSELKAFVYINAGLLALCSAGVVVAGCTGERRLYLPYAVLQAFHVVQSWAITLLFAATARCLLGGDYCGGLLHWEHCCPVSLDFTHNGLRAPRHRGHHRGAHQPLARVGHALRIRSRRGEERGCRVSE